MKLGEFEASASSSSFSEVIIDRNLFEVNRQMSIEVLSCSKLICFLAV
jgi:hypothetical protein